MQELVSADVRTIVRRVCGSGETQRAARYGGRTTTKVQYKRHVAVLVI